MTNASRSIGSRDTPSGGTAVRPMHATEAAEAAGVWLTAFYSLLSANRSEQVRPDAAEVVRTRARYGYLLGSDPGGALVAVRDGKIVGIAQSLIRGGVYTLGNLGVLPDQQDLGIGRQLLEASLRYAASARVGYVYSSTNPRALHRYTAAGFDVHPSMEIVGRPREIERAARLRPVAGSAIDLAIVDEIDADVTGRTRAGDIAFLLADGADLYLGDGVYALVSNDRISAFAATDEKTAQVALVDLLSGAAAGMPCSAMWVTSAQQWAFAAAAEARATLRSRGTVMVRGLPAPPSLVLPNAIFS